MKRRLLLLFTVVLLLPAVLLAQDGKLRGKITDISTGEALIGASITLDGTTIGAATDIDGEYIILSIPPGTYTLRVTYIGYAPYVLSNVRVSSNMTTTQDFRITSEAVQVEAVEIVAERPLVQRNTTNTVRLATQEDIENLPIRGLENILALEAGVVRQDGNLYVRGGRAGEVSYFIDGAAVTNPITNRQTVTVIQEAVEELQLQAGGYTAEYGGSNSAIARTTIRTGVEKFKGTFDFQTDNFVTPGTTYFGGSSFGFTNSVLTIGGPVMKNLKFFLAGQYNYIRNRDQRVIFPFEFDNLVTDISDSRGAGQSLPGKVAFKKNYIPGNYLRSYIGQGTLLYDLNPYKFRFTGSYQADKSPFDARWPVALQRTFNNKRDRIDYTNTGFANLRFNHLLSPKTFYELAVNYQKRFFKRVDPDFGDDWQLYADSAANADKGYTGFRRKYQGPLPYSVIKGFEFNHENAPNNIYTKNKQSSIGISGDITSQLGTNWELKAGARADMWTTRSYTINNISGAMIFLYGADGKTPQVFPDEQTRRVLLAKTAAGNINHYGYDVDGKETDEGLDAPRKPLFISAYVQNKFEYQDLILNLGVRFEHFDTKTKTFKDPLNPDMNNSLDVIDEDKLVEADPFNLLLPRFSFSFPVTNNTVFYAMYGKYAQMPSLNQLYVGNTTLSRTVSEITRGNAFLTPVGLLMKPERTTQYEMGFRQSLTDNFAFTISGFYKDLKDQLQVRSYVNAAGNKLFTAYLNEDFGTVKGLELTLELRRTARLAAKLNYTLSDARGTGSNSQSSFGAVEQNIGRPTNFINPLDFNQTHRGSLLLDYRFGKNDGGPILEELGVNAVLTFNSGHNYTKTKEPAELGQANPWNVGIRPLIDARSSFPVEPLNSSTTPWFFNIDLSISKMVRVQDFGIEFYLNVLNLLNTQNIINVYPSTGTAQDDGWLSSTLAASFKDIPNYTEFYKAINSQNRWAYVTATANDMYTAPRQVRVGVKVEL